MTTTPGSGNLAALADRLDVLNGTQASADAYEEQEAIANLLRAHRCTPSFLDVAMHSHGDDSPASGATCRHQGAELPAPSYLEQER